jgi:PhoPQ-activated pathogenicity-related protein
MSRCLTAWWKMTSWATWFASEVTPERLAGIVPMVYNNLNLPAQMAHQLETWGEYSEMLTPYTQRGLPDLVTTTPGRKLAEMIDPYTYRERATMPKLIMIGTNDTYWTLDAADLYFPELPEPKYLLYMPNEGHSLSNLMRVINAQRGFFAACVGGKPLPKPQWRFRETGRSLLLVMTSTPEPKEVSVWTATAPTRDFREATWTQEVLKCRDGCWIGSLRWPEEGFAAIFGEYVYPTEGPDLRLSTEVKIVGE